MGFVWTTKVIWETNKLRFWWGNNTPPQYAFFGMSNSYNTHHRTAIWRYISFNSTNWKIESYIFFKCNTNYVMIGCSCSYSFFIGTRICWNSLLYSNQGLTNWQPSEYFYARKSLLEFHPGAFATTLSAKMPLPFSAFSRGSDSISFTFNYRHQLELVSIL